MTELNTLRKIQARVRDAEDLRARCTRRAVGMTGPASHFEAGLAEGYRYAHGVLSLLASDIERLANEKGRV